MKCNFLVAKRFQGHEKRFSWWRKKFMAMKNFFRGGEKISWPRKTFFMGCEKDSYIINWKFMAINQGHEINNCYNGFFLNISWDFHWTHVGSDSNVSKVLNFFNSLSSEIRNVTSTASFCCKLKAFLLSKIVTCFLVALYIYL